MIELYVNTLSKENKYLLYLYILSTGEENTYTNFFSTMSKVYISAFNFYSYHLLSLN